MPSDLSFKSSIFTERSIEIRQTPHTYLHLTLIPTSAISFSSTSISVKEPPNIDVLTARSYLSIALQQYLGLTGTAIPIDILRVDGRDCWIRVPREDGMVIAGALGQWVSHKGGVAWRIRGKREWLGMVGAGNGETLFQP